MADGYEPHGTIYSAPQPGVADDDTVAAGEGCTRGMGAGWAGEGLYPVPTQHPPSTHIEHILASRAYLRPNEGNSEVNNEVSEDGSRIGSRMGPE